MSFAFSVFLLFTFFVFRDSFSSFDVVFGCYVVCGAFAEGCWRKAVRNGSRTISFCFVIFFNVFLHIFLESFLSWNFGKF